MQCSVNRVNSELTQTLGKRFNVLAGDVETCIPSFTAAHFGAPLGAFQRVSMF